MSAPTQSDQRTSLLRKNILGSFLIKGWSAVVVLLMVPVTLKCLGEYKNGVWLTISSILMWIDYMDIGLGNGLRNKLAAHLAHGETERAHSLVSSTFAMLTYIMIPILAILLILVALLDTYGFLNVSPGKVPDLDAVLMVTITFVCSTFIFKLIGNFYMGLQLPAVSNLLVAIGQTLALAGCYLVYLSGSHSLMHIALVNTAAPFLTYVLAYPVTFYYKYPLLRPQYKLVNLSEAKSVMTMGVKFFVMQISSVVLFLTSNILISKLFSPAMVTPYQIAYRYFSLMLVAFTVICMPFWNATTDAYERCDMAWIRSANKKMNVMTLLILISMVLMVAVSPWIYDIWIGDEAHVGIPMSIAMAAYIFILIYSMRYSYFINGIGKLWLQLVFTVSAAILFIPMAYFTARWSHNIIWFMAVMCLVNLPGLVVNRMQFQKLINGTAKGIWNR